MRRQNRRQNSYRQLLLNLNVPAPDVVAHHSLEGVGFLRQIIGILLEALGICCRVFFVVIPHAAQVGIKGDVSVTGSAQNGVRAFFDDCGTRLPLQLGSWPFRGACRAAGCELPSSRPRR